MRITESLAVAVVFAVSASAQAEKEAELRAAMRENLLTRIEESDSVATICVYEQEWLPPTEAESKGEVVLRAVITSVHKGNLTVGTQLEFSYLIEDSPKLFSHFRATVPGKLKYFFFSHDGMEQQNNKIILDIGTHWSCDRLHGTDAELLQEELVRNPALKSPSAQSDAGKPVTSPVVEPEGGDKPRPESEGRFR